MGEEYRAGASGALATERARAGASGRSLSLVFLVDAYGWELSRRYPFLRGLAPIQTPLDTMLGYSSTCDPTFLTGKEPREHGHFAFFFYSPETSPFRHYRFLSLLPKAVMSRARVRNKLSEIVARLHGFTGYFRLYNMPFKQLHLFDYSEKRDIFQPGGINNGQPTVFDTLRALNVPFHVPDWRLTDWQRLEQIADRVEKGDVTFMYALLGTLDAVLHSRGTHANPIAETLGRYEKALTDIVERAQRNYDEVRLFVFSDHGMTDVTTLCGLMAKIEATGLVFGRDYAATYDATLGRFWFLTERARQLVTSVLENEPLGRILSQEELAAHGCDFPDRRYGDLFFLANPGVLICPSHMGERPVAGMHGYDPADKDSTACFMTNVALDKPPQRLHDIYDLMMTEALRGAAAPAESVVP